ncbi:hypothetical protein QNI16_15320 [Cytophagaceae bacterium YF14B1]|uniref:Uncharacterized protein n=1 Tax=Xanthocytophaga flava TaxID=3048013 RepID=A0AAE3QRH3_9BACT|nr:hypothetical protein [Xanthocytophaga flavus]MDJ1481870.1 hypothetical protein [Xanthocytophaga flavus]
MANKVGTIKNPLTIIAIFAGIVEISASTVLPFIEKDIQYIYIWFLMIFPTLLVICFFITLNFNNTALYAPSDFDEDKSFLESNTKKFKVEDNKIDKEGFLFGTITTTTKPPPTTTPIPPIIKPIN